MHLKTESKPGCLPGVAGTMAAFHDYSQGRPKTIPSPPGREFSEVIARALNPRTPSPFPSPPQLAMSHIFWAGHRRPKKVQESRALQHIFGRSHKRLPASQPRTAQSESARVWAIFEESPHWHRCPATPSVGHCQLRGRGCRRPEREPFRGAKREFVRGILSLRERPGVRGKTMPDRLQRPLCPNTRSAASA